MSAGGRSVPPVSWEHASIEQILELLHPGESAEDLYRIADECGEWLDRAQARLDAHERHWNTVSRTNFSATHVAAAEHGARTRASLVAAIDDLRTVRSSLESLAAAFVDVRDRIVTRYQEFQETRGSMLGWVLASDDEGGEKARRDLTDWARSLMAQYEQTANEELAKWPAPVADPGVPATPSPTTAAASLDGPTVPLVTESTKPMRSAERQSQQQPPGIAGPLPGAPLYAREEEVGHKRFGVGDDDVFGSDEMTYPSVIGEDEH